MTKNMPLIFVWFKVMTVIASLLPTPPTFETTRLLHALPAKPFNQLNEHTISLPLSPLDKLSLFLYLMCDVVIKIHSQEAHCCEIISINAFEKENVTIICPRLPPLPLFF